MKKLSKVISIFMAAVIALSAFAVSASAVATPLTAGSTKETATNIPSFDTEYTSTLSKAGEQDWFKFTMLSEDAYYTISLENYNLHNGSGENFSLNLYVYDTYNKQIVNIQGTSSANIQLEKSTIYYIRVNMGEFVRDSTGNYAVLISYKLDTVSNSKEEASSINVNTSYKNSLDGTGDTDWFKFTTNSEDAHYTITLENYNLHNGYGENYSLNLYVYDEYNKQLANLQGTNNTKIKLEKMVFSILNQMGKSAILVTHDIEEAVATSDRVLLFKRNPGEIVQVFEIPEEIRKADPLEARGLPSFQKHFRQIWKEMEQLESEN